MALTGKLLINPSSLHWSSVGSDCKTESNWAKETSVEIYLTAKTSEENYPSHRGWIYKESMCEIVITHTVVNRIANPRFNICKPTEICILKNFIFIKSSLATNTKPARDSHVVKRIYNRKKTE